MSRPFDLRRLEDLPVLEKLMSGKWKGFNSMAIGGFVNGPDGMQVRRLQVQTGRRSFETIATIRIPTTAPEALFAAADELFDRHGASNPWD